METDWDVRGKVALITGAASGIGRATVLRMAADGATVVGFDRDADGLAAVADEVGDIEDGTRVMTTVVGDVSVRADCVAAVECAVTNHGRLDVLANVAGEGGAHRSPLEITEAGLIETLNNLIVGRYVCCQEGAKRMIEKGHGSIINIVSIAGLSAL